MKRKIFSGFLLVLAMMVAVPQVDGMNNGPKVFKGGVNNDGSIDKDGHGFCSIPRPGKKTLFVLATVTAIVATYVQKPEFFDPTWLTQFFCSAAAELNVLCTSPEQARHLMQCALGDNPNVLAIEWQAEQQVQENVATMVRNYFSQMPSLWTSFQSMVGAALFAPGRCISSLFSIPGAYACMTSGTNAAIYQAEGQWVEDSHGHVFYCTSSGQCFLNPVCENLD